MTRARHAPAYLAARMRDDAARERVRALAAIRRRAICDAIEALIDELDQMDGDPDAEPDTDTGADDQGEPDGATWQLASLRFSPLNQGA